MAALKRYFEPSEVIGCILNLFGDRVYKLKEILDDHIREEIELMLRYKLTRV